MTSFRFLSAPQVVAITAFACSVGQAAPQPAAACPRQSTGMGVVLKNPTPREPDPIDIFAPKPENKQKLTRSERDAEILAECNEILVLSHQLHLKLLQHVPSSQQPPNSAMARRIADLAHKVQVDEKAR